MAVKKFLLLAALMILPTVSTAAAAEIYRFTDSAKGCTGRATLDFAGDKILIAESPCAGLADSRIASKVETSRLVLLRDRRPVALRSGYRVLYTRHGFSLALLSELNPPQPSELLSYRPISGDEVVLFQKQTKAMAADPVVEELLASMTEQEYGDHLASLAVDFSSRFTCSSIYESVRDMIVEQFEDAGLEVTTPTFNHPPPFCTEVTGYNVVGIKKGSVHPEGYYLIGGHADSITMNPWGAAPGANDNGSGAAAVLQIAQAFKNYETESSVIFAAFGGEELGLLGSIQLLADFHQQGIAENIKGFVVLDMISFYEDDFTVLMEGANHNAEQIEAMDGFSALAQTYTSLGAVGTYNYERSDHEPFLDDGLAGALFIESDWDQYPYYHTIDDTFDLQKLDFGLEISRLAASAIATWAVPTEAQVPEDDDDDFSDDDDGGDDDNYDFDDDDSFDSTDDDSDGGGCCG